MHLLSLAPKLDWSVYIPNGVWCTRSVLKPNEAKFRLSSNGQDRNIGSRHNHIGCDASEYRTDTLGQTERFCDAKEFWSLTMKTITILGLLSLLFTSDLSSQQVHGTAELASRSLQATPLNVRAST